MTSPYSAAARHLHWLIALLVAMQFAVTLLMPDIDNHTPPEPVIELHFTLGLSVVLLMAVRLWVRLRHPVEPAASAGRPWERTVMLATHRLFYTVLLVVPFLGWISASAHSVPVLLLGLIRLPDLAPAGAEWGHQLGDVHGLLMWTLLGLVTLHAAAALFHHWIRHDDTLRRMLPGRER